MRFLVKCEMPVEAGNAAIADPEFGRKMEQVLKEVKAEAAYFTTVNGCRGGYIVLRTRRKSPQLRSRSFCGLARKLNSCR